jgi:hypothetical protein
MKIGVLENEDRISHRDSNGRPYLQLSEQQLDVPVRTVEVLNEQKAT